MSRRWSEPRDKSDAMSRRGDINDAFVKNMSMMLLISRSSRNPTQVGIPWASGPFRTVKDRSASQRAIAAPRGETSASPVRSPRRALKSPQMKELGKEGMEDSTFIKSAVEREGGAYKQ